MKQVYCILYTSVLNGELINLKDNVLSLEKANNHVMTIQSGDLFRHAMNG